MSSIRDIIISTPKECKAQYREKLLKHFNSSWKYPVTVSFGDDTVSLKGADGSILLIKRKNHVYQI